jgi:hypothetical protein
MTTDSTNLETSGVEQNPDEAATVAASPKPEGAKHVRAFTINVNTGEVLGYTRASAAKAAREASDALLDVVTEKDLKKVPGPVLVKVWNYAIESAPEGEPRPKTITRFSDQESAARRVWPVVEYLGENRRATESAEVPNSTEGDTTVATKTKKTRAAKKVTAKAPSGERKPRTTGLGSMLIEKLGKYESGRAESQRTKNWALVRDGMKVSDFLAKGGSHIDLRAYEQAKVIKLRKAPAE